MTVKPLPLVVLVQESQKEIEVGPEECEESLMSAPLVQCKRGLKEEGKGMVVSPRQWQLKNE
jgi:hypothetical protein